MTSDKKALVVGINKYKNFSQNNLNGCVNDTRSMVSFLKNCRGFTDNEITVLTDEKATKANIMKGLNDMVNSKCKYIAFTMSSHGTQMPDIEHDESDGLDEAFCPTDLQELNGNWDPDHVIKDDELHDLFVQLPSTTTVEVWLDTCHSGTGLKAIDLAPGRVVKFIPPPSMGAFLKAGAIEKSQKGNGVKQKAIKAKHILWSACSASQTSSDAQINGVWNGAFTYYFCQDVTGQALPKATLAKVKADLKANHYSQTPQYSDKATTR